ncbi:MAG: short-chain dehydrogenase [Hydrocarboniphaga sp.]|uniref:SDR family oxidoreductase n=1 Tax=Hydrocarboniphaga sp. TaxID=2033016 RepID=UPI00260AFF1F|nr:SDR family oxidoreductase [Hydrocarboniphaga sp.]MDB5970637.1 short-chain dehydrogenase [Hydrocarboniphaga sp.]
MELIVVIGVGGMGTACARRLGSGHRLLLADCDAKQLQSAAGELSADGFDVRTQMMDVSDREAVAQLAEAARHLGPLRTLVLTAGVSPLMAGSARIYEVDLLGTALVLDAFVELARAGSVAVVIASMAGSFIPVSAELERALASLPAAQLLDAVAGLHRDEPQLAYCLAKRGTQLRVQAAALPWAARGARVVSVSPGLIATPMGRLEQSSPEVAAVLANCPLKRIGNTEDIAAAVQWLASPAAGYVTGTDLRIDGGSVAALLAG